MEAAFLEFENLYIAAGIDFQVFKNKFLRLAGETGQVKIDWKRLFNRKLTTELQTALASSYIKSSIGFDAFTTEAA